MRILFVTNRFPGQFMRGDQLRAFHQIRLLSARHAITLLAFEDPPVDSGSRAAIESYCTRVITIRRSRLGIALGAFGALVNGRPVQVGMYDLTAPGAGLDAIADKSGFDLAHVQLARLGPMLNRLSPLPCVLDFVDALSKNMARRAEFDRGPLRWIAGVEASRLAKYERMLCTAASAATICSELDRDAIGNFENLKVVGNGVDLERFPFVATRPLGAGIVFVGNLGYFPNIDAASWFMQDVMPLLVAAAPRTRLKLVGARPAPALRRVAAQSPNVELVGPVPDVHPFLTAAAVAVAPLRAGSGQQLKILEAMASGTPVVATSLSAAGLDAIDGQHLLVADDPISMAAAINRLLSDSDLSMRLARAARTLVETRYSWERSALDLERVWIAAAGG